MQVVKRGNGGLCPVDFNQILTRISNLVSCVDVRFLHDKNLEKTVDPVIIAQKTIAGLHDGITTEELDELAAEISASKCVDHPDYAILASRITISNLHKTTSDDLVGTYQRLYDNVDNTGKHAPAITKKFLEFIKTHDSELRHIIKYERDYRFNYFGVCTLLKSYLLRVNTTVNGVKVRKIVERPQHLYIRNVAQLYMNLENPSAPIDWDLFRNVYDAVSLGYLTHATPTLFNSCTDNNQLLSCFLLGTRDSLRGISKHETDVGLISGGNGGLGLCMTPIRARGSMVRSNGGGAAGVVPQCRTLNEKIRSVSQTEKRNSSCAVYLEPWHADMFNMARDGSRIDGGFMDIGRKDEGNHNLRCPDLFTALWVPDLLYKRADEDSMWSFMCPDECPGLWQSYGEEFESLYTEYERQGRFRYQLPARTVWLWIAEAIVSQGHPYILNKDHCNRKNNQSNVGVLTNSNLCAEILEYCSDTEYAGCCLASIGLPMFVNPDKTFDHHKLFEIARLCLRNLDIIIDRNKYPVPEAEMSMKKHRQVAAGIQGLNDVFMLMRIPYDSPEAKKVNVEIMETIYYACKYESWQLAREHGPYSTFAGSPLSKGLFEFDLWGVTPSDRWDWETLRQNIIRDGVRNALTNALMPTASTSNILGNAECFDPAYNMVNRSTIAGVFSVVNQRLVNDLVNLGLWNTNMRNKIMAANGSIQHIAEIPQEIRDLYKLPHEIKARAMIEMAADRGAFVDQTQSFNLYLRETTNKPYPLVQRLITALRYGWQKGLKTGLYYLRTGSAVDPIKITVATEDTKITETPKKPQRECKQEPGCDFCSA